MQNKIVLYAQLFKCQVNLAIFELEMHNYTYRTSFNFVISCYRPKQRRKTGICSCLQENVSKMIYTHITYSTSGAKDVIWNIFFKLTCAFLISNNGYISFHQHIWVIIWQNAICFRRWSAVHFILFWILWIFVRIFSRCVCCFIRSLVGKGIVLWKYFNTFWLLLSIRIIQRFYMLFGGI